MIRISRTHALEGSEEQIRDTVLRDRTRDRGTRGWPWTAVEGNSTANRGNTKGDDL